MTANSQSATASEAHSLGAQDSVWYKLSPLLKDPVAPLQTLLRAVNKYGGIIPANLGNNKLFFMSNPDHFKHVLVTNQPAYVKYFEGLKPIFGNSMITMDGELWQKIRMPQQPAFHPSKFEEYMPYLLQSLRKKEARWNTLTESGEEIEMVEETWTLAVDMVCRALFDREVPFNPHFVFGMVKAYTNVLNHKNIRQKMAAGEDFEISQEGPGKAAVAWSEVTGSIIEADIVDHRSSTLLTLLQEAEADPEAPEFNRQQIVDEIKQYLWAGAETTALTLAWCLYVLSQNPEIKEKIRAEAYDICGDDEPTWEQAQQLSYTKMVIQETMRMYPPVWALIRTAAEEDEIGGHKISPGDQVVLCTYAAHHNPEFWNEPEEFRPERFAPGRMKKRAKYTYMPFGAGRRSCIGGALSQLENGLALAQLLRKFEPEYVGEVPARITPTVTLTPGAESLKFKIHKL